MKKFCKCVACGMGDSTNLNRFFETCNGMVVCSKKCERNLQNFECVVCFKTFKLKSFGIKKIDTKTGIEYYDGSMKDLVCSKKCEKDLPNVYSEKKLNWHKHVKSIKIPTKYNILNKSLLQFCRELLAEKPKKKKDIFNALDAILWEKKNDPYFINRPHRWETNYLCDNFIIWSNGIIDIQLRKKHRKYIVSVEPAYFGKLSNQRKLPLTKYTYDYSNVFQALQKAYFRQEELENILFAEKGKL